MGKIEELIRLCKKSGKGKGHLMFCAAACGFMAAFLCSCAHEPEMAVSREVTESTADISREYSVTEHSCGEGGEYEYQNISHDCGRKFYDFIMTEPELGDCAAFDETDAGREAGRLFREFIEESGVAVTDVRTRQVVYTDLDRDGRSEAAAVISAGFEAEGKAGEYTGIGTGEVTVSEDGRGEWSGLCFVSSEGDVSLEADCLYIEIENVLAYPGSEQLKIAFTGHDMMYIADVVYGCREGEITELLTAYHTLEKDGCFLELPATVGPYHPVDPALFYWDCEGERYETVGVTPISPETFGEVIGNCPENELRQELSRRLAECGTVMTIGNRFYILTGGSGYDMALLRSEDGSLEKCSNTWLFLYPDHVPADVDYFAALENMNSVNS